MSTKKIKVYYYYPIVKNTNLLGKDEIKVVGIENILNELNKQEVENRVVEIGEDNIQLKKIEKAENGRWRLGFLRNTKDTYFKSKLDESIVEAEKLDEDEFIGLECCMIYDEVNRVVSLQNNIKSISYHSLEKFFREFTQVNLQFTPLTLKEKYNNISDEPGIDYRNIVLNFIDISEINRIAREENNEAVLSLAKISNNLEAVSGKIELGVGRSKLKFLKKNPLKDIVGFFKNHPKLAKGLKVKVVENGTIRLIDLIENKIYHDINIAITSDDPKTFNKILDLMDAHMDLAIDECLDKCNAIVKGDSISYVECIKL